MRSTRSTSRAEPPPPLTESNMKDYDLVLQGRAKELNQNSEPFKKMLDYLDDVKEYGKVCNTWITVRDMKSVLPEQNLTEDMMDGLIDLLIKDSGTNTERPMPVFIPRTLQFKMQNPITLDAGVLEQYKSKVLNDSYPEEVMYVTPLKLHDPSRFILFLADKVTWSISIFDPSRSGGTTNDLRDGEMIHELKKFIKTLDSTTGLRWCEGISGSKLQSWNFKDFTHFHTRQESPNESGIAVLLFIEKLLSTTNAFQNSVFVNRFDMHRARFFRLVEIEIGKNNLLLKHNPQLQKEMEESQSNATEWPNLYVDPVRLNIGQEDLASLDYPSPLTCNIVDANMLIQQAYANNSYESGGHKFMYLTTTMGKHIVNVHGVDDHTEVGRCIKERIQQITKFQNLVLLFNLRQNTLNSKWVVTIVQYEKKKIIFFDPEKNENDFIDEKEVGDVLRSIRRALAMSLGDGEQDWSGNKINRWPRYSHYARNYDSLRGVTDSAIACCSFIKVWRGGAFANNTFEEMSKEIREEIRKDLVHVMGAGDSHQNHFL